MEKQAPVVRGSPNPSLLCSGLPTPHSAMTEGLPPQPLNDSAPSSSALPAPLRETLGTQVQPLFLAAQFPQTRISLLAARYANVDPALLYICLEQWRDEGLELSAQNWDLWLMANG